MRTLSLDGRKILGAPGLCALMLVLQASAQQSASSGWMTGSGQGPYPTAHAACTAAFYSWANGYWSRRRDLALVCTSKVLQRDFSQLPLLLSWLAEPTRLHWSLLPRFMSVKSFPQSYGGCGMTDTDRNAGPTCIATPNPIGIGTGNKYLLEVDWRAAGASRLAFERHYKNSQIVRDVQALGANWTHTYSRWIEANSTRAIAYRANGRAAVSALIETSVVSGRRRWTSPPTDREKNFGDS